MALLHLRACVGKLLSGAFVVIENVQNRLGDTAKLESETRVKHTKVSKS